MFDYFCLRAFCRCEQAWILGRFDVSQSMSFWEPMRCALFYRGEQRRLQSLTFRAGGLRDLVPNSFDPVYMGKSGILATRVLQHLGTVSAYYFVLVKAQGCTFESFEGTWNRSETSRATALQQLSYLARVSVLLWLAEARGPGVEVILVDAHGGHANTLLAFLASGGYRKIPERVRIFGACRLGWGESHIECCPNAKFSAKCEEEIHGMGCEAGTPKKQKKQVSLNTKKLIKHQKHKKRYFGQIAPIAQSFLVRPLLPLDDQPSAQGLRTCRAVTPRFGTRASSPAACGEPGGWGGCFRVFLVFVFLCLVYLVSYIIVFFLYFAFGVLMSCVCKF